MCEESQDTILISSSLAQAGDKYQECDLEPDSLYDNDFDSESPSEATMGDDQAEDEGSATDEDTNNIDSEDQEDEALTSVDESLSIHSNPTNGDMSRSCMASLLPLNDSPDSARMTKSMLTRSESRQSQNSISFFVDFSEPEKCNPITSSLAQQPKMSSRSVQRRSLHVESSPRCVDQLNHLFKKFKEYVDYISENCFSKDEVKQKLQLVKRLETFLDDQEARLKSGKELASIVQMDSMMSAFEGSHKSISSAQEKSERKPMLRRERTFDLTPGTSLSEIQVVDISMGEAKNQKQSPNRSLLNLTKEQEELLELFRIQKESKLSDISQQLARLTKLDRDLSLKASTCGPERVHCWEEQQIKVKAGGPGHSRDPITHPSRPVPRPRTIVPVINRTQPQRPSRKCDSISKLSKSFHEDLLLREKLNVTTLANVKGSSDSNNFFCLNNQDSSSRVSSAASSSSCAWFIPNNEQDGEKPVEVTADSNKESLIRTYRNKKMGIIKPEAYFIDCTEGHQPPKEHGPTDFQDKNKLSIQEALKEKRPDYINNSKVRETKILAKKVMKNGNLTETLPSSHYHEIRQLNKRTKEQQKQKEVNPSRKRSNSNEAAESTLTLRDTEHQVNLKPHLLKMTNSTREFNKLDKTKVIAKAIGDPSGKLVTKENLKKQQNGNTETSHKIIKVSNKSREHLSLKDSQTKHSNPPASSEAKVSKVIRPPTKLKKPYSSPYSQSLMKPNLVKTNKGIPGVPNVFLQKQANHCKLNPKSS